MSIKSMRGSSKVINEDDLKEKILQLKDLRKKYKMDDWVKTSEYLTLIELESELKGFLAGQKAEQDRILGIIDLEIKKRKELVEENHPHHNLLIPSWKQEIYALENIKSQINNSPSINPSRAIGNSTSKVDESVASSFEANKKN